MLKYLKKEFSFVSGNVSLLVVVWAVTDFAQLLPSTYYSLYVEALGASPFLIGAVLSASSFTMAFLQLVGGYWADKRGRRSLVVSTCFLRAITFLILPQPQHGTMSFSAKSRLAYWLFLNLHG